MNASPGSIKTMEVGGRYLFVGSYDETIKVFDIKKYKMLVILDGHLTGITCLKNHKSTLFSGSEEGKIITWQHKTWGLLTTLKDHQTAIEDLDVHESGRLMISISKDNRMFIWNLLNSKKAYQRRFGINLHKVKIFNEDIIILLSDKLVSIFKTSENKEIKRIEH